MHRTLGISGSITAALLSVSLLACAKTRPPVDEVVELDQGGPDSPDFADVVKKCRDMAFDETKASAVQRLDPAGRVMVRIIPATRSSKTKLSQLSSRKGRVVAKVVNEGDGDWRFMALKGRSESCWYVWGDNEDRLHTKFVSLAPGGAEVMESLFDIQFHDKDHPSDLSAWNPIFTSDASETGSLFRLTSFPMQGDSTRGGNTGWTTCIVNGCCRSRQ